MVSTVLTYRFQIFLIIIFALGTFLRFYRLPQTMQFLGDQGRDALIARGVFMEHDPAFIGPVTSVGNMYLGPFYYYFMVFPLMLTYPSPVGPAYAVALVGVITLALIYFLGKEMVGQRAAVFAYVLYALSPVVIENVRFSWNPNIVPFFSLLLMWSVFRLEKKKDERFWVLVGICAAALFQLHYIALALVGLAGLYWIYHVYGIRADKKKLDELIKYSLIAAGIFLVSLTPLLIFDATHNWLNVKSFSRFFDQSPTAEHHFRKISDVTGVLNALISLLARIATEFFGLKAITIGQKILVGIFVAYFSLRSLYAKTTDSVRSGRILISIFLLSSVMILSLYSASLFDHYLGFIFPLVFLVLGMCIDSMFSSIALLPLGILLMALIVIMSLRSYPGMQQLDGNIFVFSRTANAISARESLKGKFNILLYSRTKDLQGMNYRYFLTANGTKPVSPDDWINFDTLVIIDEEERKNPFDESQYVINIWPNRTIVDQFRVPNGPEIYILQR